MSKFKKCIALLLCASLLFSAFSVASSASLTSSLTGSRESRVELGNTIDKIIQAVIKGVCKIYPKPRSWKSIDKYTGENVYDEEDGRADFLTEPADNAQWKLGYASGSIIPEDFEPGKYYLGRQLNVTSSGESAKAKGVLDDQRVRVICMDDNSGEGAVVMAVIDGLGVTSNTIRKIRAACSDYTESGKIAAINISATHCHSALDTQGVSTSLLYVMAANVFLNLFGKEKAAVDNDPFIDNLIAVATAKIKEAYDNMEPGKLYYDVADTSSLYIDKREYIDQDNLPDAGILRFEPENPESKGTYLVNFTSHPTIVSAKAGMASSDYVYYMDYMFQKAGYNMLMQQGAVGQVSGKGVQIDNPQQYTVATTELKTAEKDGEASFNKSDVIAADIFGEIVAKTILDAKDDSHAEEELPPVLNAKYTYTEFTTTNYTLYLACVVRLVDNEVYTTGRGFDDVVLPSEIGYVEVGGRVGFGLFPCEFYPEVFHGKDIVTNDLENYSWDGSEWTIKSGHDMVPQNIDMYAVCFANDYVGYVVPDNFYSGWGHWALKGSDCANYAYDPDASIFDYIFRGTADQLLSAGKHMASQIMTGFENLTKQIYGA